MRGVRYKRVVAFGYIIRFHDRDITLDRYEMSQRDVAAIAFAAIVGIPNEWYRHVGRRVEVRRHS